MKYTMKSKLKWFKINKNNLFRKMLVLFEIIGSPSGMFIFEHKKHKKCDDS